MNIVDKLIDYQKTRNYYLNMKIYAKKESDGSLFCA